jgi:hypothetical protein
MTSTPHQNVLIVKDGDQRDADLAKCVSVIFQKESAEGKGVCLDVSAASNMC